MISCLALIIRSPQLHSWTLNVDIDARPQLVTLAKIHGPRLRDSDARPLLLLSTLKVAADSDVIGRDFERHAALVAGLGGGADDITPELVDVRAVNAGRRGEEEVVLGRARLVSDGDGIFDGHFDRVRQWQQRIVGFKEIMLSGVELEILVLFLSK